jgi:hypothetical protein
MTIHDDKLDDPPKRQQAKRRHLVKTQMTTSSDNIVWQLSKMTTAYNNKYDKSPR